VNAGAETLRASAAGGRYDLRSPALFPFLGRRWVPGHMARRHSGYKTIRVPRLVSAVFCLPPIQDEEHGFAPNGATFGRWPHGAARASMGPGLTDPGNKVGVGALEEVLGLQWGRD